MGNDPKTSVVNRYCRVHDVDNVYVIDGSVHVTNGGFNPALTIMANAYRLGTAAAETGRERRCGHETSCWMRWRSSLCSRWWLLVPGGKRLLRSGRRQAMRPLPRDRSRYYNTWHASSHRRCRLREVPRKRADHRSPVHITTPTASGRTCAAICRNRSDSQIRMSWR